MNPNPTCHGLVAYVLGGQRPCAQKGLYDCTVYGVWMGVMVGI